MSFCRTPDGASVARLRRHLPAAPWACFAIFSLCLLWLASCGYRPVFGPGAVGEGLAGAILVREPGNHEEYVFTARLEQRLGRPQGARYRLDYGIETRSEGVGRTPEQRLTRYNVTGIAEYRVIDLGADRTVHSGKVESLTSYSAAIPLTGARAAGRDASERLMVILADQVTVRVLATYRDWSG